MHESEATRFRLQLMSLHRRLRAEHLQDAPLNELLALGAIDRLGPQAAPSAIAQDLRMARSNLSTLLRQLEKKGWVVAHAEPDDKRRRVIALTAEGRVLLTRDRQERESWLRAAAAATLSTDEQHTLLDAGALMQRLADAAPSADPVRRPTHRSTLRRMP